MLIFIINLDFEVINQEIDCNQSNERLRFQMIIC